MVKDKIQQYLNENNYSIIINNQKFNLTVIEYKENMTICSIESCDFEKFELCNKTNDCLSNILYKFLPIELQSEIKINRLEVVLKLEN
jgi:hypothetical protein